MTRVASDPPGAVLFLGETTWAALNADYPASSYTGATATIGGVKYVAYAGRWVTSGKRALPKFKRAVEKARAGIQPALVLVMGDSTTSGRGSVGGDYTTCRRTTALPYKLAKVLNKRFHTTTAESFFGDQNTQATYFGQYDPRIVMTGAWHVDTSGPEVLGGNLIIGGTTGSFVVTPEIAWDKCKLFFAKATTLASSINVSVNGTLNATINTNGTNAIFSQTFTAASKQVQNLTIDAANNTCYLLGGYFWDSSDPGIIIINGGWDSAYSYNLASVPQYAVWDCLPMVTALAPDLTVVNCTINDCHDGKSLANYTTYMGSIVQKASAVGDVLLVGGQPSNSVNVTNGNLDQFVAANAALTRTYALPAFVDFRQWFGASWAAANSNGMIYDTYHPNSYGYQVQISALVEVIMRYDV